MTRTSIRAWLASAALVAAVAIASAAETAGERYYKMRLAKVAKSAAARIWDAADRARRASLFRFARSEAQRVLELDPDNKAARTFLGYVKKDEGWTMDLTASGTLPTENRAPVGGAKLADLEATWRTVVRAKADIDVAALYAALGDECAGKSYRDEAKSAYALALGLDRDNAAAHTGLGHVRLGDGLWLTAEANAAFEASRGARAVPGASRLDDVFREKLNKMESGHFRVESPHADTVIAGYLDVCEKTFAAYLCDFEQDPAAKPFPKAPVFCLLETDAQWERWINHMAQSANQGFWRSHTFHWARDRGICSLRNHDGATDATRRDRLIHETAHMLNLAVWDMADGCWLDDAIAYRYPLLLTGTTGAYCLAPKKEDYGKSGAVRNWTDPGQWRPLLKETAAAGDDTPLRLIVNKRSYDLPISASVKAWSVVDFLLRRDRPAFVGMLKELKVEKDLVGLLETRFGRDVEVLDAEWRRWVAETY